MLLSGIANDIKDARKIRLPKWAILCGIVVSTLMAWLFDHFGRFDLELPVMETIGVLGFAIAVKWKLRSRVWFWITMAIIATLHVVLVLLIPWTTKWIPVAIIIPILTADFYAILWVCAVVGTFVDRRTIDQR